MKRSLGFRFLMVSLLTLLMFIPMFFVSSVVQDRKSYSRNTLINVGNEWGGEQVISGPYLSIPVEETITEISAEAVVDAPTGAEVIGPDGKPHVRSVTRQSRVNREPIIVYPDKFDLTFKSQTQIRYRGIFKVPVYQADVEIAFNFPKDRIVDATRGDEEIQWDKTVMVLNLSNNADAHRQHEIYCSGYANDNRCIFLDWNPVTSEATTPELLELAGFTTRYNDYDSHGVVISGWNNTMFFTYLNETDKVESVEMSELPKRFSSGGFAMWLAAKEGYKEILLAGFGDTKHAYREYAEGVDIPHVKIWEEERKFIIDSFKDVKWRYV